MPRKHVAGGETGADLKWSPSNAVTFDATINPDSPDRIGRAEHPAPTAAFAFGRSGGRSGPFFWRVSICSNTPIRAVYRGSIDSPELGDARHGSRARRLHRVLARRTAGRDDVCTGADVVRDTIHAAMGPEARRASGAGGRRSGVVRRMLATTAKERKMARPIASGGPDSVWKRTMRIA